MGPTAIALTALGATLLLLSGAFGLLLWRIARLRRTRAASRTWPSAPGVIVSGAVRRLHLSLPRGGAVVRFGAILVYEYSVAGRAYRSERFNVDGPQYFSSQRAAEAMLAKFPARTAVTVFYDPAAPGSAVLSHKAPSIMTLWFVLVCSFLVAAALLGMLVVEAGMFDRDPLIRL